MNKNIKKQKNRRGYYSFFGVIFIALCVFLAIECATSGTEMAKLINSQASSLGFNEPQKVVYIQKSNEFASLLP